MTRCLNCMGIYDEYYDVCPHCGFVAGTLPKEAFHLHPGMTLSERYIIVTVLGFGGVGITYRVWDAKLQIMIAIKAYYPSGIVNRIPGTKEVIVYSGNREDEFLNGKRRFLDEARNMARFSEHPNIVHVLDFFEENQTAYIAMEFLDGLSFKQYLKENGDKLLIDEAVGITAAVLDALKAIHKQNIIHRDISPDNILICRGGVIKLIDFGAARFSNGEEEKTLSIVLKPGYAPPEQYRSKSRQGPWTDIYAVGAVLYRAITGVMPDESVNRMVSDEVVEPKTLRPEIPDYLNNSVMRAIAVDQELRFQEVDQFKAAIQDNKYILSVEEELRRRKKTRSRVVAALSATILLAALGCIGLFQKKAREAELRPAAITVWLPETDLSERIFNEMMKEYRENNSQIQLDVTYIPEPDYNVRLEQALKDDKGPVLFESGALGREYDAKFAKLDDVLSDEERAGYFFFDTGQYFADKTRLPLAFQLPVLYVNQLMTVGQKGVPSRAEDMELNGEISLTVNPAVSGSYAVYLDDKDLSVPKERQFIAKQAYRSFADKKTAYYFSDTSEYGNIKDDMAGVYAIEIPGYEKVSGSFSSVMSVRGDAGEDQIKAAKRLLYYMLSERAQDTLAVQGKAGLPVNRKVYNTYLSLNAEFEVPEEMVHKYRFEGSGS